MSENELSPFKLGVVPKGARKRMRTSANASPVRKFNYDSPNYLSLGDSQPDSGGPAYKLSQPQPYRGSPMVLKDMHHQALAPFLLPAATGYKTPASCSPAKSGYNTPKSKLNRHRVIAANDISMVVQPPIGEDLLTNYVGKLFVNESAFDTERKICENLVVLDPDQKHLVYGKNTGNCVHKSAIQKLLVQHPDFNDAIEKETRKNKNYTIQQLIMPYGGNSMKQITSLTFAEFIKYGVDMLNGVEVLQQGNYVHQDIMLKNVLVDESKARLADFGTVLSFAEVFDASKNERIDDLSLAHPPEYFNQFQTYYNNVSPNNDKMYRKQFMKLHGFNNKEAFKNAFVASRLDGKLHSFPWKIDVYSVGMVLF